MSSTALGILPFVDAFHFAITQTYLQALHMPCRGQTAFNCEEKIQIALELERSDFKY